jgi:hypothetical protein
MSSSQLDILALEPYHGGHRRAMLDAIARCSRHRWTILKLPARRIERRLLVSATWFAEHLSRNEIGNVDLIFASEALNLADFFRLRPDLSNRPAVVYFHDNQLPDLDGDRLDTPTDLVNLNSATAATEIWFNSLFNLKTFLSRASGLVMRHRELQSRNPMPGLAAKAHLMPPPLEVAQAQEMALELPAPHPRSLLVDARGGDHEAIATALSKLHAKNEAMQVTIIGRVGGLPSGLNPTFVRERDDAGHIKTLFGSSVLLTARQNIASDDLTVLALALGRHVIAPCSGVYPELLPEALHAYCFHDGSAESIVERLLEAWYTERPQGLDYHIDEVLAQFDAISACRIIDERLESLAGVPARV